MFSVGLVTADSYMTKPLPLLDATYSEFRGSEVNLVPVIRVFGSTPTGEKACLHVHGVFPYLYVPCGDREPPERLVYRLASALDKALNVSLGCSASTTQHVYCVALLSAIPFYGYHETQQQFLKVSLYNPVMVKRAADLLQSGAVLGHALQPHYAHLPFVLQFMIDYNLHGMSPVLLERALFRRPAPSGLVEEELLLPENVQRISSCELEVDALASAILNPRTLHGGVEGNPGLTSIWEEERERRRAEGRGSQPTPYSSQPRSTQVTSAELHQRQLLHERLATLQLQEAESQAQGLLDNHGVTRHPADFLSDQEHLSVNQLNEEEEQMVRDLLCLRAYSDAADAELELEQQEEDEEEDLYLPLESPGSSQCSKEADVEVDCNNMVWEDSYWDHFVGRIPQLDGADDDEDNSTHSPVICSGKFGRQNRVRETRQLTGENVIDGTCWPEYRGLLDGLCDLEVNPQLIESPSGSALSDSMELSYDFGLDLDALEVGPVCAAPTPGAYESLPAGLPAGVDLTNYNLADISEDYSGALINDVFLSSFTDDATQCTDIQSVACADFSSNVGFQTPQSELMLDGEDTLVEETRRVPIPSKTVPAMLPVSKDMSGLLRSCEDGNLFLGAYSSSECMTDAIKNFPTKQFENVPAVNNYLMMAKSDGSVNILNTAIASTAQFPSLRRDNTYVRLVPLSEYRSRVPLGGEGEVIKTSCIEHGEAGLYSSGMFSSAEPFANGRRVVSVDRTTETSPSLLRCSNSDVSGRATDCNFLARERVMGFEKNSSAPRNKSNKVVKFFLKSSLLREKPVVSINQCVGTNLDSGVEQLRGSGSHSGVYHSTLLTKSHIEKSSKLFRYEKSPPRKLNSFCEPFIKKSRALCEKLGSSGRVVEGHERCGVLTPSSRFCDRFIRDVNRPRSAAYHVSNAEDFFMSRKESAYHKSVAVERFEGRRAIDIQSSPTTSEEDKTVVKVESSPACSQSSPARSRSSPEDHAQFAYYRPMVDRKHRQECRPSEKGDYDPYVFSDEMEELLSCGSPSSWSRRCTSVVGRPPQSNPMRGGKPASYLQHGAAHRVTFHMTNPSSTYRNDECDTADETVPLGESSRSSNTDAVVGHIKSEPVWDQEVTSIPKLTLVRAGDNYINLVRLDDDEASYSPLKQEQPSEEDRPIEVAAVKDENEQDTCESSCSLEQAAEDKSVITARSDVYSPEMHRFGHFSGDDCPEVKDVVCEMKDTQLEAAVEEAGACATCVVASTSSCDTYSSEPLYKVVDCIADKVYGRQLFASNQVATQDNITVEVVDLSPSSNDASIEILEVSCSSGDSHECGSKVSQNEAVCVELSSIEPDEIATAVVDTLNGVDTAVGSENVLPMSIISSEISAGQQFLLPVVNEEHEKCEVKEVQTEPIGLVGPPAVSEEAGDRSEHGVLSLEYRSSKPEVVSANLTVSAQQKQKFSKVPKSEVVKVRKVGRVVKIPQLKAVSKKKASFVVKKRSKLLMKKESGGTSVHVKRCCKTDDDSGKVGSEYVKVIVAEALHKRRGRLRAKKLTPQTLSNRSLGETTFLKAAVTSTPPAINKQYRTHLQNESLPKITSNDKRESSTRAPCKQQNRKIYDESNICVSGSFETLERVVDIAEHAKNVQLKCLQPRSVSEQSDPIPVTSKSLHISTSTEVCNNNVILESVCDALFGGLPSKPPRSGRQKTENSENTTKTTAETSSGSGFSEKSMPKTTTVVSKLNQVESRMKDNLNSELIVSAGLEHTVTKDAVHPDGTVSSVISHGLYKHVGRATSRADGKASVEQSPAEIPARGRKKIVNVSSTKPNKKYTPPSVPETEPKLHFTEVNCNQSLNLGYKILSVSLSKALPKCRNDSKLIEQLSSANLKITHESERDKLSQDFAPKIIKKRSAPCHHLQTKTNNCIKSPVICSSRPQVKSKKFGVTCKESSLKAGKKVHGSCVEMKKLGKSNKNVRLEVSDVEEKGSSESKMKVKKRNGPSKSIPVGTLKQNERETATGSTHLDISVLTENVVKSHKRKLTDTLSQSCTKRKLRKRCGEIFCQSKDRSRNPSMQLKVDSKEHLGRVGISGGRPTTRKAMNTRAAMKTMCRNEGNVSQFDGHNDLSSGIIFNRPHTVPSQNYENTGGVAAVNNSLQQSVIQQSLEKIEEFDKIKVPKVSRRNHSKLISEVLLCRTLRNGKKVSNFEVSRGNVERGSNKILSQSAPKATRAVASKDIACNPPAIAISKVGRSRKMVSKEDHVDKHQEVVGLPVTPREKLKCSKLLKRNSVYVKQLRSYTSKHPNEAAPPRRGRARSFRKVAAPSAKGRPNMRIPCLDGASGTSSSEEESLINCSQPGSPEPPLKRLKDGLVAIAGRRALFYRSNAENKTGRSRHALRGKKCGMPEKGRLAVGITKSPRRQHERVMGTKPQGYSSDLVLGTPPVCEGQCLAAVEATSGIGSSSENCVMQNADLVTEGGSLERLLVPSRTLSEVKPKIIQFNSKNYLFPSACDNIQEGTIETVGAINHRTVRKKLEFSVDHQRQQQQQISGGKQPIKILRRSSLDMFSDSSSLSGDACKCGSETSSVCKTSDIGKLKLREEVGAKFTMQFSEANICTRDEQSLQKQEDSEEDEGIISFYETTLLSPAESGCSYDSLCSLGQLPFSPQLQCSMEPRYRHREPFYSDPRDVTGPMQVGNIVLHLHSGPPAPQTTVVRNMMSPELGDDCEHKRILVPCSPGHNSSDEELLLSPESSAPTHSTPLVSVNERGRKEDISAVSPLQSSQISVLHRQLLRSQLRQAMADSPRPASRCQLAGATPDNTHAFLLSFHNLQQAHHVAQHTFLTLLSVELHASTRGDLRPDPQLDPIQAVFYSLSRDIPGRSRYCTGMIVVGSPLRGSAVDCEVERVADEMELLAAVERLVATWDPDILAGYQVEALSWGYLFERSIVLGLNLCPRVSRVPDSARDSHVASSQGDRARGDTHVAGRILLDVWRLMRHQVALQSYTYESVAYHVLHERRPRHSHRCLTAWWDHPSALYRWIVVEYYLDRTHGTVRLLEQLDLLTTTSELARLFGIQFHEVLTRGSQFRVESMMLRLAILHNYVAVSPSVKQRAAMRAPEHLQLIMEPESRFYSDPVIVLDFQSLYPSIIIAYNYCFSTCLGHARLLGQPGSFQFGCSELRVPLDLLEHLLPDITISPCGVAFVGPGTRLGILPRMLQEILRTRLMVKQAMKEHPEDKALQRVLHARQLGLKLIANVTYGYTAANFSGRMPCVEVGDSVVSKGRETLERAIQLVENTTRWHARVIYGDTDSMFVLVEGRSRAQAFAIGAEIAQAVTLDNPVPVKLKLEKVYQPCILQTKKRYVGYAYESPNQDQPKYDAKGIETVRRDGCPAVAKVLEKALRVLFDTRDVSLVKRYVCRQWDKLMQGRANVHDLVFAREYRGRASYRPGACVPALQLARRWLQVDPRAEPRVGERVPYVIVNGPPAVPLIQLVRSPYDLLADPSLRVNARYYITRVIMPSLKRCFSLLGADVDAWYASMPRKVAICLPLAGSRPTKCSTISQYFATVSCAVCEEPTHGGLCPTCLQQPQQVAAVLGDKLRLWERAHHNITQVCQSCCGRYEPLDCSSLDCPVLFRRSQARRDVLQEAFARQLLAQNLPLSRDW